jgi:hypothetical protein
MRTAVSLYNTLLNHLKSFARITQPINPGDMVAHPAMPAAHSTAGDWFLDKLTHTEQERRHYWV